MIIGAVVGGVRPQEGADDDIMHHLQRGEDGPDRPSTKINSLQQLTHLTGADVIDFFLQTAWVCRRCVDHSSLTVIDEYRGS
jgi:hypothetical protein